MADDEVMEEGGGQEYQPTAQSGLNKIVKILIYVALGAVGLVLMVVVAFYVATFAAQKQYTDVASIVVMKPPPPLEAFNFSDDFRANTADRGESHFIKLKLSLGFEQGNAALSNELAQRKPQLINIVNLILANKTKAQLSTVQDQLELREEIKASVNHVLSNGKIQEVYFTEFIVN